jgi:hypothetical protein
MNSNGSLEEIPPQPDDNQKLARLKIQGQKFCPSLKTAEICFNLEN